MTINSREQAAAYLASLTEQDAAEFYTGARTPLAQIADADLTSMTPAQINKARREGRLDSLLGKN